MKKTMLFSGNEAIAEAAIQAGCTFYAGYPITPQNELIAYMAEHLPAPGRVFIQSESELAAINMVYGASAAGARAMTSSSSPGISLKQEGISYLSGSRLPAVVINVMRAGPGLGNIWPAQSDYFQATKGGGHGDYRVIVLAPWSVQESYDLTKEAFDLADRYRMVVMVLSDGMLGQMMEGLEFEQDVPSAAGLKDDPWVLSGAAARPARVIRSLFLDRDGVEENNRVLQETYCQAARQEVRWTGEHLDDAELVVTGYGSMARMAKAAVINLRSQGQRVGFLRPISLWPFPARPFADLSAAGKSFLVVEMSYGQMVEDVQLAVGGASSVDFLGRAGGGIPTRTQIEEKIWQMLKNKK